MRRLYASELGEGDTIVIPPSLVISKAKINKIDRIPTKAGDMIIVDVESNGGLWTPSKARFAFHAMEKVECRPHLTPLRERLRARLRAILNFLNPLR